MALDELKSLLARGLAAVGAHDAGASLAATTNEDAKAAIMPLLVRGLQKLYAAHRQGAAQAEENSEVATAGELKKQLRMGAQVNLEQRTRLEEVFRAFGLLPEESPDAAMQGIIDDNKDANARIAGSLTLDLLQIDSGQIAAHFFVARYGTLRSYAQILGNAEAAGLLKRTLEETVSFDDQSTKLAHRLIAESA